MPPRVPTAAGAGRATSASPHTEEEEEQVLDHDHDIKEEQASADEHQLIEEGIYSIFGVAGARTEMPGCSLCMGNQARVAPNSTVVSTSTRNFPNRLGQGANVYLASSELAAVCAALGKIPTMDEYMSYMEKLNTMSGDIYRYLNFNEIQSFMEAADRAKNIPMANVVEV